MFTPLILPKALFHPDALRMLPNELKALGAKRPLIVTDSGIVAAGLAERLADAMGHRLPMFTDVHENPTYADAEAAHARYTYDSCDAVVALGGGSVIDTAKFVAMLGTNAGTPSDYVGPLGTLMSPIAPLIAIPTTAGTGSECSPDAGIHPDATTRSTGVSSWRLVPRTAILDINLTLSLPPRLTAATGLDALSHCIEGFLSTQVSPLVDVLAIDGIRRICLFLKRAVADGGDLEARHQMMAAAFAGGAAISKGLGPAHAVAITCSDQGLHHGVLSAIGLISTLPILSRHTADKILAIQSAMGLRPTRSVAEGVAQLCHEVGLPVSLATAGYRVQNLESLSAAAHASHFNQYAPYQPTASEFALCIGRSTHQ
jgi:4-hydroxybutyrate dehydrogenase